MSKQWPWDMSSGASSCPKCRWIATAADLECVGVGRPLGHDHAPTLRLFITCPHCGQQIQFTQPSVCFEIVGMVETAYEEFEKLVRPSPLFDRPKPQDSAKPAIIPFADLSDGRVRPSFAAKRPKGPITDLELAKFKKRLERVSFRTGAKSMQEMLLQWGIKLPASERRKKPGASGKK